MSNYEDFEIIQTSDGFFARFNLSAEGRRHAIESCRDPDEPLTLNLERLNDNIASEREMFRDEDIDPDTLDDPDLDMKEKAALQLHDKRELAL